jgi:hypothetical protein
MLRSLCSVVGESAALMITTSLQTERAAAAATFSSRA